MKPALSASSPSRKARQFSAAQQAHNALMDRFDTIEAKLNRVLAFLSTPSTCTSSGPQYYSIGDPLSANDITSNDGLPEFDMESLSSLANHTATTSAIPATSTHSTPNAVSQCPASITRCTRTAKDVSTTAPSTPERKSIDSTRAVPTLTTAAPAATSKPALRPVGSAPRGRLHCPRDPDRDNLICQLKAMQRSSAVDNHAWHSLCDEHFGSRDPAKVASHHIITFLSTRRTSTMPCSDTNRPTTTAVTHESHLLPRSRALSGLD